jgi:hypothetical protein
VYVIKQSWLNCGLVDDYDTSHKMIASDWNMTSSGGDQYTGLYCSWNLGDCRFRTMTGDFASASLSVWNSTL